MQLFWGITDRGSVRKENQDAYGMLPLGDDGALGIVCDGMGGARAGNIASQVALDAFSDALHRTMEGEAPPDLGRAMLQAAEEANQVVYRRSVEEESCRGMGTTIVAAAVDGSRVFVVNVGDSRCYLADQEAITQITRDHSLVEDLVARGEITPEEARSHPRKNLITRALGVDPSVRPDLYELDRQPGSFLLLCSDGLSNLVTDPELLYEIIHGGDPSDCCRRLLDIALSRGAPDNVTAVLMQL